MTFNQTPQPRLGQPAPSDTTMVQMFAGAEIPEAAYKGQIIYRTDTQHLEVFDGNAWEEVAGSGTQASGILTYVGPTQPATANIGDIWYDSDAGNAMYRFDGGTWVLMQDAASAYNLAQSASTTASNAQSQSQTALTTAQSAQSEINSIAPIVQPTSAPSSSPSVICQGLPRGIMVKAADVASTTTLEYHISTTNDFTPDSTPITGTLATTTRSLIVSIFSLPNGTLLDPSTPYYVKTIAKNSVGAAPSGPEGIGYSILVRGTDIQPNSITSDLIQAGQVTADKIGGGEMDAGLVVTGSLQIGQISLTPGSGTDPATDPNYDPGGLDIPLNSGGAITFPADGTDASIQAHLDALSITVQDRLTINGVNNDIAGEVVLDNAPTAPKVAPALGMTTLIKNSDLAGTQITGPLLGTGMVTYNAGLIYRAATNDFVFAVADERTTTTKVAIMAVNKSTGAVTTLLPDLFAKLSGMGGVNFTALAYDPGAKHWYVLYGKGATAANSYVQMYVRTFDANWNQINDYQAGSTWSESGGYSMTYDTVAGNIIICGVPQTGSHVGVLTATVRDAASGAFVIEQYYPGNTYMAAPYGVNCVSADFGVQRLVISRQDAGTSYVYPIPTSGAAVNEVTTSRFRSTSAKILGCTWDGSNFWYLIVSADNTFDLRKLAAVPEATNPSVTWTQYCDGTRFGSTGTYETKPSPASTIQRLPRSYLKISTTAPNDGGRADDPNESRIYVNNHLQGALPDTGSMQMFVGVPNTSGAAPPSTEGFVSSSGGSLGTLQSQAQDASGVPYIQLKGDGSVVLSNFSQSGFEVVNVSAAGGVGTTHVTFRTPFPSNPQISVSVNGTNPNNFSASFSGVSNTGFDIYLWKYASGSNTVHWIATLA